MLGDSFIALWVGEGYTLPYWAFVILIINTFISMTRTYDIFINAYGLFQDIWYPIIEAIVNLSFSILLGYHYGITGILGGVMISLVIVVCNWRPYFLYSRGFKENVIEYIIRNIKYIGLLAASFFTSKTIIQKFILLSYNTYLEWIIYSTVVIVTYTIISFVLLYSLDKSSRDFSKRFLRLIKH